MAKSKVKEIDDAIKSTEEVKPTVEIELTPQPISAAVAKKTDPLTLDLYSKLLRDRTIKILRHGVRGDGKLWLDICISTGLVLHIDGIETINLQKAE